MDNKHLVRNIELMRAIKNKDFHEVERRITIGANVNFVNVFSKDQTPLHEAVASGDPEIVKLLLDKGANINVKNGYKEKPMDLIRRLEKQQRQAMRKLFDVHLQINQQAKHDKPENEEKAKFDAPIDTYDKRRGKTAIGQYYQTKLLTMTLFRLLHLDQIDQFWMISDLDEARNFGNIVLKIHVRGEYKVICLNAQHNLPGTVYFFDLRKYFYSFLHIRYLFNPTSTSDIIQGEYEQTDVELIVFTPASIHYPDEFECEHTTVKNIFQSKYTGRSLKIKYTQNMLEKCVVMSKEWHKESSEFRLNGSNKKVEDVLTRNYHETLVKEFCSKFNLYLEQATEDELEDIIRREIRFYNYENDEALFFKSHNFIESWCKQTDKVPVLTEKRNIFKEIACEEKLKKAHLISLIRFRIDFVKFRQDIPSNPLRDFLKEDDIFFVNIASTTPDLSCIKIIQLYQSHEIDFKFIIIEDIKICSDLKVFAELKPDCLIIAYLPENNSAIVEDICQKVKKLIVVTKNIYNDKCKSISDETNNILDFDTQSQEKLLEASVLFQNSPIPLGTLLNNAPRALIDAITLQKLVNGEELMISYSCFSKNQDDSTEYYIDRVLLDNRRKQQVPKSLTEICDDIVVVAAEAGMGKSTLLAGLAKLIKQSNPSTWIIRIDLLDYSRRFFEWNEKDIELNEIHAFNLLVEAMSISPNVPFEKNIFQWYCEQSKIYLLVDGFDEISPDYTNTVLNLLQIYKHNFTSKLWVTTRTGVFQKELEKSLTVQSYCIKPFTLEEAKQFLWNFWSINLHINLNQRTLFENYVKQLLCHLSKSIDENELDLISVPLHIKMVAIIFQENFKAHCNSNGSEVIFEELDSITLYEKFIDIKHNKILIEQKHKNDITKPHNMKMYKENFKQFEVKHKHAAICALFNPSEMENLEFQKENEIVEELIPEVQNSIEKTGIITQVVDGKPVFVHRTYTEFFAAKYLWEKYSLLQDEEFEAFVKNVLIGSLVKNERAQTAKLLQEILQKKIKNCMNVALKAYVVLDNLLDISLDSWREFSSKTYSHLLGIVECSMITDSECFAKLGMLVKTKSDNIRDMLLLKASESGHIGIVRLVIEDNSDRVNATFNWLEGWTALHFAANSGHKTVVEYLVSKSANIDKATMENEQTALYLATEKGHHKIVQLLLDNGAKVNTTLSNVGNTPLHLAAQAGSYENVLILLSKRKEIDINSITPVNGETALHIAAGNGNLDVVQLLINQGADANIGNKKDGSTPLHVATNANHSAIIRALLEKHADINAKTNDLGLTALHMAAQNGFFQIAYILIDEGADVNSRTSDGQTTLHIATAAKQNEIVQLLLKNGANPNLRNSLEMTPLHLAAQENLCSIATILLKKGADVDSSITTDDGKTPLVLAEERGNLEIVQLLKEKTRDIKRKYLPNWLKIRS